MPYFTTCINIRIHMCWLGKVCKFILHHNALFTLLPSSIYIRIFRSGFSKAGRHPTPTEISLEPHLLIPAGYMKAQKPKLLPMFSTWMKNRSLSSLPLKHKGVCLEAASFLRTYMTQKQGFSWNIWGKSLIYQIPTVLGYSKIVFCHIMESIPGRQNLRARALFYSLYGRE